MHFTFWRIDIWLRGQEIDTKYTYLLICVIINCAVCLQASTQDRRTFLTFSRNSGESFDWPMCISKSRNKATWLLISTMSYEFKSEHKKKREGKKRQDSLFKMPFSWENLQLQIPSRQYFIKTSRWLMIETFIWQQSERTSRGSKIKFKTFISECHFSVFMAEVLLNLILKHNIISDGVPGLLWNGSDCSKDMHYYIW